MNVFVLSTGRCGSTTFVEACRHITNYSAKHESQSHLLGEKHLSYPENHIESDNRLSWFLGRLEKAYGDDAAYVHLKRDARETAESYSKRRGQGSIFMAYWTSILIHCPDYSDPVEVGLDYVDTVNSNIEAFLKDKSKAMTFQLETAEEDFRKFWEMIGGEGDLEAGVEEWRQTFNATDKKASPRRVEDRFPRKVRRKLIRVMTKLPHFVKNA